MSATAHVYTGVLTGVLAGVLTYHGMEDELNSELDGLHGDLADLPRCAQQGEPYLSETLQLACCQCMVLKHQQPSSAVAAKQGKERTE